MQATGQYGEVPQCVGSRVGASHGHMFNISHEMSLSSTTSGQGQGQGQGQAGGLGHGHGLSLSHPPHSQASQSHMPSQILSAPSQPSFLQSHQPSQSQHHHQQKQQQQQQQQQVHHGFNMSNMGGSAPKTSSAPLPPLTQQVLQSAAQQLQADIKQHQQVHHTPHSQQQAIVEYVQQKNPQQPIGDQGNDSQRQQQQQPAAAVQVSALELVARSTLQSHGVSAGGNKGGVVREESLDGDEQDDDGEKGSGGNRWPRQEALALLKIRSEMDAAFRDSSIKGPLWEEISRKLAEMGYQRSAKKCKEKFENVHKYYKRTKEGKTGRQDGKSYRFFSQLEALYGKTGESTALLNLSNKTHNNNNNNNNNNDNNSNPSLLSLSHGDNGSAGLGLISPPHSNNTLNTSSSNHGINLSTSFPPPFNATSAAAATNAHIARTLERVESIKHDTENSGALHFFIETSDDDDDEDDDEDDELDEPAQRENGAPPTQKSPNSKKRKRKPIKKYLVFFEKVMKKVLDKQEHMQQKFLEALERRDHDRMMREEAWKRQEMARLNREQDVWAAERALSASREASLVTILQKMTGQSVTLAQTSMLQPNNQQSTALVPADYMQNEYSNADKDPYDPMNKRWPKPEVLALIKLRTSLDRRFHEPGSKAVLWEEISAGMTAQGFARTSKRCKEKWENINKYFKKAKESNKKRPENAKTCPYFHHLNALYKEGLLGGGGGGGSSMSSKHLAVTEKGEEQSEGVMEDQQNNTVTSNNGVGSGQAEEGESEALPVAKEVDEPGSTFTPTNAGTTASANLALGTSTANADAKMHMFMGSGSSDKDASLKVVNEVLPLAMDASASGNNRVGMANSLLFNLEQGMGSTKGLASGFAQQQQQSRA